jgi:hypothetical protein
MEKKQRKRKWREVIVRDSVETGSCKLGTSLGRYCPSQASDGAMVLVSSGQALSSRHLGKSLGRHVEEDIFAKVGMSKSPRVLNERTEIAERDCRWWLRRGAFGHS